MSDTSASPLPAPPWKAKARKRSRPRQPLSAERIVEAAFAVMAKEGFEAVTMRRLATELGTGPASLYAHVENKAELDDLILDELAKSFLPPTPDPDRWREQITDMMREMRNVFNAHPGVARAVLGTVPTSGEMMRGADAIMGVLLAGGVHEQVAAWSIDLLALYVSAIAFEESVQMQAGDGRPHSEQEADFVVQLREYFTSLPADRFPHLAASAIALTTGDGEERFEFGLAVLVAGIEAVSDRYHAADAKAGSRA